MKSTTDKNLRAADGGGASGEAAERKAATNLARIVARLLLDPRGWRVDALMQDLGIGRSTFYNYLARLQALPVPELQDKDGQSLVTVVPEGDARYLRMKRLGDAPEERDDFFARAMALQMARQAFSFLGDVDLRRHLDDLVREFHDHVRQKHVAFVHLLRNLDRAFVVLPRAPKDYRGKRALLQAILRGLEGPYRLKLTYETPGRRPWTKLLEPLTLVVHDSALYLLVRSPDEGHVFTLAVERILKAEKTGEAFHYPPRDEYDPLDFTEGAFGMLTSEDDPIEVELVFANKPWLKKSLRERHWHKTQSFFELPDGRLRMTFRVRSMAGVWPWIRGYGDLVEVVRPVGST